MKTKDNILEQEQLNHDRIRDSRKLVVGDVSGRSKDVVFEVNWNKFSKKKGFIKISIDNKTAVVDRQQLWGVLFMLGSAYEQEKLVSPFMHQVKVHKYTKMIGITTSRDIRKGEMINTLLEFTLNPETNTVTIGKGNRKSLMKI
mgnify:FL=1